jgi:hypothetical protein
MDVNNRNDNPMTRNRRVVEVIIVKQKLTTTDINSNTETEGGPIVGYAKEPLLPLVKACAPLTSIIHNLWFYVQLALNETPEDIVSDTCQKNIKIKVFTYICRLN